MPIAAPAEAPNDPLNEYQLPSEAAQSALGLCSEAGEVAGLVKRVISDHGGRLDDETVSRLGSGFETEISGLKLELADRLSRGAIQESGDDR